MQMMMMCMMCAYLYVNRGGVVFATCCGVAQNTSSAERERGQGGGESISLV